MSGTSPVGNWALPFSTGPAIDDPTTYKGKLDANFAVAQRFSDAFAPKPASPAAMSVMIDAGFVVATGPGGAQTVTEIGAQSVAIAAAPAAPNNRIDLVVIDDGTGSASVIAGTPAGTPSPPPLAAGKKQIAQIAVPNGTIAIGNGNISDLRALWHTAVPGIRWTIAGGASDAITASYAPANAALADGLVLGFRAAAANATASPTFNPDGLGAKAITKYGGQALVAGDIAGALAECLLRYNAAYARWELLNPKSVPPPVTSVNGLTGAVSLASGNLSDGGNLVRAGDSNTRLANGANYAVRGEGVSEFANNAGYITAGGYGSLYSYTVTTGPGNSDPYSPGGVYAISGLSGSWECMSNSWALEPGAGSCCPGPIYYWHLFQRIA